MDAGYILLICVLPIFCIACWFAYSTGRRSNGSQNAHLPWYTIGPRRVTTRDVPKVAPGHETAASRMFA
jgi:hypothetical protein